MQLLSNLTAKNVPLSYSEGVWRLRRRLVMIVLCPATTVPVKEVPGAALLTAARSSIRILPMYSASTQ